MPPEGLQIEAAATHTNGDFDIGDVEGAPGTDSKHIETLLEWPCDPCGSLKLAIVIQTTEERKKNTPSGPAIHAARCSMKKRRMSISRWNAVANTK